MTVHPHRCHAGFTLLECALLLLLFGAAWATAAGMQDRSRDIRAHLDGQWEAMARTARTPGQRIVVAWLRGECSSPALMSDREEEVRYRSQCIRRKVLELSVKSEAPTALRSDLVALGLDPARLAASP